MNIYEIYVDDKDYDSNDGYTLLTDNKFYAGILVEIALQNGFVDIRISNPHKEKEEEYKKNNKLIKEI